MIYGIGVDLVAVARIAEMHARHGGKLAQRILAPEELGEYAQARDKDRFLAKRFAAKEAFAKAVGSGVRAPVLLTSIIVTHTEQGRPGFDCAPELRDWLRSRKIARIHLSISDERDHAVAFATAEAEE